MRKTILRDGLTIVLSLAAVYGITWAWNTGLTVSSGDTLTSTSWNQMVANIETNSGKIAALTGGTSVFSKSGNAAYYTAGNVGIGTTSPSVKFEVN